MTINELRIGNRVIGKAYPDDDGKVVIVESVDDGGINLQASYEGGIEREFYHDDIFPIPLTTEILEKAGFKKGKTLSSGFYGYSNGVITLDNDFALGLYDGRMDDPDTKDYYPETKYLHQLQNLYFALTGEELTISL